MNNTYAQITFLKTGLRHALRAKRRSQTALQAAMALAVLATVPAFLLAGIGGGFFDSTQIATLYLLLIGIAFRVKDPGSKPEPEQVT